MGQVPPGHLDLDALAWLLGVKRATAGHLLRSSQLPRDRLLPQGENFSRQLTIVSIDVAWALLCQHLAKKWDRRQRRLPPGDRTPFPLDPSTHLPALHRFLGSTPPSP